MIKKLIVCALLASSSITFSMIFFKKPLPRKMRLSIENPVQLPGVNDKKINFTFSVKRFYDQSQETKGNNDYHDLFELGIHDRNSCCQTNMKHFNFASKSSINKLTQKNIYGITPFDILLQKKQYDFALAIASRQSDPKIMELLFRKFPKKYYSKQVRKKAFSILKSSNLDSEDKILIGFKFICNMKREESRLFLENCLAYKENVKNINKQDEHGNTPLLNFCKEIMLSWDGKLWNNDFYNYKKQIIKKFAEYGANFHCKNNKGKSSLDYLRLITHGGGATSFFTALMGYVHFSLESPDLLQLKVFLLYYVCKAVMFQISPKKDLIKILDKYKIEHDFSFFDLELYFLKKIIDMFKK